MTSGELQNLARIGSLKAEPPDRAEFLRLLASGRTRLRDAKNADLALESQFDLAYNAAHALCLAALRWHGYRAANRYVVFQAVQHTIGLPAPAVRVLARSHQIRNATEYQGQAPVTATLVNDLLAAASLLEAAVADLDPPKR